MLMPGSMEDTNSETIDESTRRPWYYYGAYYIVKVLGTILPAFEIVRDAACLTSYCLVAYGISKRHLTARQGFRQLGPALVFGPRPSFPQIVSGLHLTVVHLKRTKHRLIRHWSGRQSLRLNFYDPSQWIVAEAKPQRTICLDPSDREIRLLHLTPGNEEDQVCVSTAVASLNEEPVYIAISYVWGDTSLQHAINVDGRCIHVSTNLFATLKLLRNVRGKDEAIPFWIDALSINQEDSFERSQQVRMMKAIYGDAYRVWVWLNSPTEESELALAKMRAIEAYFSIMTTETPKKVKSAEQEAVGKDSSSGIEPNSDKYISILPGMGLEQSAEQESRDNEPWKAIHQMLESPWW